MNASNVVFGTNTHIDHRIGNSPVGNGVKAERIALKRASFPVNVEIGNGAIAPKVALKRASMPVNVEIGNGAIAPRVAIARRTSDAKE
jgi:hypothetical protein